MKKFLKEPLLHFILIGAGIFILYSLSGNKSEQANKIVITDNDVNHIVSIWKLQWHREPTAEELSDLVEKYIRQEVLYREALNLNLDANDEIIKRRMAQKMEFMTGDVSALVNVPTDEELKKYFEQNKSKYLLPERFSFCQVVFTSDNHSDSYNDAVNVLKTANNDLPEKMKESGDRFSIPFFYNDVAYNRVIADLGGDIAKDLQTTELNKWSGPFRSGFGWHLVYLTKKTAPASPEFADIKDVLIRDFDFNKEQETRNIIYKDIMSGYDIDFELSNADQELIKSVLSKINS